jgi:hypothetical protein
MVLGGAHSVMAICGSEVIGGALESGELACAMLRDRILLQRSPRGTALEIQIGRFRTVPV